MILQLFFVNINSQELKVEETNYAQTNKLSNFLSSAPLRYRWSVNPLSKHVVVPDSSEFIDGVPGRRLTSGGTLPVNLGVKRRSRSDCCNFIADSSTLLRLVGDTLDLELENLQWELGNDRSCNLDMSVQVTSASDTSSEVGVGDPPQLLRSSGTGRNVPPRRTVSTAAWQTCQFPVHKRPTAPFTGFTVRPQASYNKDWNNAAVTKARTGKWDIYLKPRQNK